MPNDDLGTFPVPNQAPTNTPDPLVSDQISTSPSIQSITSPAPSEPLTQPEPTLEPTAVTPPDAAPMQINLPPRSLDPLTVPDLDDSTSVTSDDPQLQSVPEPTDEPKPINFTSPFAQSTQTAEPVPLIAALPEEDATPAEPPIISATPMVGVPPLQPPLYQAPKEEPLEESPIAEPSLNPEPKLEVPAFEETPDVIPSVAEIPSLATEQEKLVQANEDLIEKQVTPEIVASEPQPALPPVAPEILAAVPPKTGKSAGPIIIVVLLVVAGIGLAAAAFMSAQTSKLKTQLQEITQTLEKQETTLTPTATPTVFEAPTPTLSPVATQSAVTATPSATPTIALNINNLQPLKNAATVLKVAINHSPNAQLILIKVDNAADQTTSVTKYFFREDLTTKKYFYVAISGKGEPEIIDKQIYVTPDDNIPSLNDAVLTNKLGLDLDEAVKTAYTQCANQATCTAAPIKAQYIKTGTGIIWQLSIYTKGLSATPLMIQINAETKAILYKSPEFANK